MNTDKQTYIVSARKYRPATFASVVGQQALTRTLKNAIETGRLAQAYLFCGPRGVGKTSCARIFAKTINCLHPTSEGEACGECSSCRAIEQGNSFNIIELDAASNNSVDDIRKITDQVNVPPQEGRYRVFIIDEVHMLSSAAFNAFLKTLEEPPSYVIFILATTEKHKVIPTILSRCQIYDFKRITTADMTAHLQHVAECEGIHTESAALDVIARKADGAMRDALSIFDQVAAASQGNLTYQAAIDNLNVLDYDYYFRLVDAFREGDVAAALLINKDIRDKGFDSLFFINGLASHLRDLMVGADKRTVSLLEVSPDVARRYLQQAVSMSPGWYYEALSLLNDADLNYRTATNKELLVEITLIKLCNIGRSDKREASALPPASIPRREPGSAAPDAKPAVAVAAPKPAQTNARPEPRQASPSVSAAPRPRPVISAGVRRPATTRLHGGASPAAAPAQDQAAADPAPASDPLPAKSGSRTTLEEAWHDFINGNPDQQVLISAMRASKPEQAADGKWIVKVANQGQVQMFEGVLEKLTNYLRRATGQSDMSLSVVLGEAAKSERAMTQTEYLRTLVERNPALGETLTLLDAELM